MPRPYDKTRKIKKCSVSNCNSDENSTFLHFPGDRETQLKWIEFCEDDSLRDYTPGTLARSFLVCERHFANHQYRYICSPFKKRLRFKSIPELYPPPSAGIGTETNPGPAISLPESSKGLGLCDNANKENDCDPGGGGEGEVEWVSSKVATHEVADSDAISKPATQKTPAPDNSSEADQQDTPDLDANLTSASQETSNCHSSSKSPTQDGSDLDAIPKSATEDTQDQDVTPRSATQDRSDHDAISKLAKINVTDNDVSLQSATEDTPDHHASPKAATKDKHLHEVSSKSPVQDKLDHDATANDASHKSIEGTVHHEASPNPATKCSSGADPDFRPIIVEVTSEHNDDYQRPNTTQGISDDDDPDFSPRMNAVTSEHDISPQPDAVYISDVNFSPKSSINIPSDHEISQDPLMQETSDAEYSPRSIEVATESDDDDWGPDPDEEDSSDPDFSPNADTPLKRKRKARHGLKVTWNWPRKRKKHSMEEDGSSSTEVGHLPSIDMSSMPVPVELIRPHIKVKDLSSLMAARLNPIANTVNFRKILPKFEQGKPVPSSSTAASLDSEKNIPETSNDTGTGDVIEPQTTKGVGPQTANVIGPQIINTIVPQTAFGIVPQLPPNAIQPQTARILLPPAANAIGLQTTNAFRLQTPTNALGFPAVNAIAPQTPNIILPQTAASATGLQTANAIGPQAASALATQQEQAQNPWPHLKNYYAFKSREGDKVIFECKVCLPDTKQIMVHHKSLKNLKDHMEKEHPNKFHKFIEEVEKDPHRGNSQGTISGVTTMQAATPSDSNSGVGFLIFPNPTLPPSAKKVCSQMIKSFGSAGTGTDVAQATVDQKVIEFFIDNMLPLSAVESESFERLIKTLNPSKNSNVSKKALANLIIKLHNDLKHYLIKVLSNVQWVSITSDCWCANRETYLDMTAHWLDPNTRERQQALLACIRVIGHGVLSQAMIRVLREFKIAKKVNRITTDNGSNFMKSFTQFGAEANILALDKDAEADEDAEVAALLAESEPAKELEYITLTNLLDEQGNNVGDDSVTMPSHITCAAHTINLVASRDAEAALHRAVFEEPYRGAIGKASALWKWLNDNFERAASICSQVGSGLVVPNSSKWISIYDSLVELNSIMETKRSALEALMTQLKLDTFTDQDVDFLKEYTKVMSPMVTALETILDRNQAYLGTLLPTVVTAILELRDLKSECLVYCNPLVDALLEGIDARFRPMLEDEECQMAAAFHPKFHLTWLEKYDSSQVEKVTTTMEAMLEEVMKQEMSHYEQEAARNKEDADKESKKAVKKDNDKEAVKKDSDEEAVKKDIDKEVVKKDKKNKDKKGGKKKEKYTLSTARRRSQKLVKMWLETNTTELLTNLAFLGKQVLVDMFIFFNTIIPSSAAVEHSFSIGRDFSRAKKTSMSDKNFDMLIFVKGNMHLKHNMEKEKRRS